MTSGFWVAFIKTFQEGLGRNKEILYIYIKKFFHSFLLVILVCFFLHWNILFLCILLYSVKCRSSFIPDDYSVYQYHLLDSCSFSWWFITYYFLYLSGSVSEHSRGFSGGTSGKEPADQCRRHKRRWFDPWIGNIHWRRSWQPTPGYLPRASPWTEEPGGLQSIESHRVRHYWSNLACTHAEHSHLFHSSVYSFMD